MGKKKAPESVSINTGNSVKAFHEKGTSGYSAGSTSTCEEVSVASCDSSLRYPDATEVLGIVGGMGPLASTRFLESIYRFGAHTEEQNAPACILISNPRFVDRTLAVQRGQQSLLVTALSETMCQLEKAGATRFVIACFTAHSVISELPVAWRKSIISLVDVLMEQISESSEPHLVLCTTGTRRARILEEHPSWSGLREYIVLPDEEDQALIHDLIYEQLKSGRLGYQHLKELERLADKYRVRHLTAACTEFHLLQDSFTGLKGSSWSFDLADPLLFIAQNLDRFLTGAAHVQDDEIING